MNYKQKQLKERELISLVKRENSKEGNLKVRYLDSDEHEITKLIVLKRLKAQGFKVWTEVPFNSPFVGRPDIFAVKNNLCYIIEILYNETEKDFKEKIKKYPNLPEVTILSIKTEDFDRINWCL